MNPEAELLEESDLVIHAPESIRPAPVSAPATVRFKIEDGPPSSTAASARLLGIGRHALIKRIEAYGIGRPRKPS